VVSGVTLLDEPDLADGVDPRIQARRDEVVRARHRRRRRWQVAIFVALALMVSGWFVTRTALLDVDQIRVTGSANTPDDEVRAATGVSVGDQVLDVDTADVRARLLGLPWIADAIVDVSWRGDLTIEVREREPVAMIADADGRPALVDGDGRVLAPATLPDADLVAVNGMVAGAPGEVLPEPAGDALAVVRAITPGLRSRIASLTVTPDRQIELQVWPSGSVRFCGATDVDAKVRALQTVFAQVDDTDLRSVDVCVPDQPVVTRDP
jgi:cell division protein FtsQ